MLKFTRGTVIAFDFKDALSFEGETGPYIQYAIVRIRNIFRKAETTPETVLANFGALDRSEAPSLQEDEIWAIWLRSAKRSAVLAQCIATSEPAFVARHVFQLAQEFNNSTIATHILTEEDPAQKTLLLATAAIALRVLVTVLNMAGDRIAGSDVASNLPSNPKASSVTPAHPHRPAHPGPRRG